MLVIPPPQFRKRHGTNKQAADSPTPPPPIALTLVAATYDENDAILTLTFDRPVSVAAYDGSALTVGDPTFNDTAYEGSGGAFLVAPATVQVNLQPTGPYSGTEVDFVASAATGIVAADDGGTWAGTGGVMSLPYP